jgi:hypothetical protein
MKPSRLFHPFPALFTAILALFAGACDFDPAPDPGLYADDKPGQGAMSRARADQVFTWGKVSGGAEIVKFRSAPDLSVYLAGGSRQSSGTPSSLVISRIAGVPVVRIAPRAFSPAVRGGDDDITTVVSAVQLPDTIESLGEDLFAGVDKPVMVSIPPAVAEKIPPGELQAAAGDRATIQKIDPGNPSKAPEVIVRGPSVEDPSTPNPPDPPPPSLPPVPKVIAGPVVTYSGASGILIPSAAYTFDRAVKLTPPPAGWTLTGDGTASITATPVNPAAGVAVKLSFTVGNPEAPERTTGIPEITLMPVSAEFVPQAGETYTLRYGDRYGAVGLKEEGGIGWYYAGETRHKRVFNALYTPNAPDSPPDGIGDGKSAIAYTTANRAAMSDRVLELFKIRFGNSPGEDRIEIRGPDLPSAAGAGFNTQIVIDIGLPATGGGDRIPEEEDNSLLPGFVIPDRGLGTPGVYDYIRFRVNGGASLVIEADNGPYLNTGDPCPPGNLEGATVEVMPRGKLRSGAYEGEPLGKDTIIIARNGSALALGPERSFGPGGPGYDPTRDEGYRGWFIGSSAESPRILWDGGDQTGNYLEIQGKRLAFAASITVRKSLRLPYDVWFVSGPTLTIDVSGSDSTVDGQKGLFAVREDARFYGNASSSGGLHIGNPASTIIIRPGNSLSRSFVTENGSGAITAGNGHLEIRNGGRGTAGTAGAVIEYYRVQPQPQIGGYFNWSVP